MTEMKNLFSQKEILLLNKLAKKSKSKKVAEIKSGQQGITHYTR